MSDGNFNLSSGHHNRRSIRLRGYDYSRPGYYFVTICINDRKQKMFGDVVDGRMVLNNAGECARQCWLGIPAHFPNTKLVEYIVMPNHIHGIIVINDLIGIVGANNYSPLQSPPQKQTHKTTPFHGTSKTIGSVVRGYKIGVTKWFRLHSINSVIWQRNYYEHIIRDEREMFRIKQYIRDNPANWDSDEENPSARSPRYVAMPNPQRQDI